MGIVGTLSAAPAGAGLDASPVVAITSITEAANLTCHLATLDVATGELTQLGPDVPVGPNLPQCPADFAPSPDGRIFGARSGGSQPATLVTIDPTTGVQTEVGSMGFAFTVISGLEFDAAGALWFTGNTDDPGCEDTPCLYSVDATTGATALVGSLAESATQVATPTLARSCDGPLVGTRYEYPLIPESTDDTGDTGEGEGEATRDVLGRTPAATGQPQPSGDVSAAQVDVSVLTHVDPSVPALTEIGPLGETTVAVGMAFAPDGTLYALTAPSNFGATELSVSTIDPATGLATEGPVVAGVTPPTSFAAGLTFFPLDCAPDPIVLEPTFTG
jgi:hypothetical protein